MDRFEEWMELTAGVSSKEFDRLIDLKRKKCACPFCPTYTDCAKRGGELLYCISGRSPACIDTPLTCVCPDCPVAEDLGLAREFYCIEGSEAIRRKGRTGPSQ